MGTFVSRAVPIAGAVFAAAQAIQAAFRGGRLRENPVVTEIDARIRGNPQCGEDAWAQQAQAESARERAERVQHRAIEQLRQTEENTWRLEKERLRTEEARKNAEQILWRADEDRRVAEERVRQAVEQARRANEERERAERKAQRAQEERDRADRARQVAEQAAVDAGSARAEAERQLREGIRPIIIPTRAQFEATKRRLQYTEGMFHFAVAGISGSGKSSLINAFRGLRNSDRGAAATGIVETTSVIARYPDGDARNPFVWYDVPGAGTLSVPDWQYFTDQGLYIFDCIVVLFDSRFTATDVAILRNCARSQIPTYIVRSKSNQHIQNLAADMESAEVEDNTILLARAREQYERETRESVRQNLHSAGLPDQRVYLVDKESLVQVARGRQPRGCIDEWALLNNLLSEARRRRVVEDEDLDIMQTH